jgi:hypothetical protein
MRCKIPINVDIVRVFPEIAKGAWGRCAKTFGVVGHNPAMEVLVGTSWGNQANRIDFSFVFWIIVAGGGSLKTIQLRLTIAV